MNKSTWIEYYVSRIRSVADVSLVSARQMAEASFAQDPDEDPTEAADIELDYLAMDQ